MFDGSDILYEDNHIMAVNKRSGMPVQADLSGDSALEDEVKAYIKRRDSKPGAVFLGVIHRIDRPVSGVVLLAKTSKALARMNEAVRSRDIVKRYFALVAEMPEKEEGELVHYIWRDGRKNRSYAYDAPKRDAKEARLRSLCPSRYRSHHGTSPSDKGPVVKVAISHTRRFEIRGSAIQSGR